MNCHKGYEELGAQGPPRTGHSQYAPQLCPGSCFSFLILHVAEHGKTMSITAHIESPTATNYFWALSESTVPALSTAQPCKFLLSSHARRWQVLDFTEQHFWHPGYRQEHIQLWRDTQELTTGPQHGKDTGLNRLLGSTCYLCIYSPGWMRVFLWNLCVFTQVLHACYSGTQLCLLG